jgi:hypothetical protein
LIIIMAKVVTISFGQLQAFDADHPDAALIASIGEAFGPSGLGIVAVEGVPDFAAKRQALLPLAAKLPALPDLHTTCVDAASMYSVGWSHGREELSPGQPDYNKGSFYANPLTDNLAASLQHRDGGPFSTELAAAHPEFFAPNVWPAATSLPELQPAFVAMGRLLHHVGCLVGQVCDSYCLQRSGGATSPNMAATLKRSLNAKGRLLHYFAPSDNNNNNAATSESHNDSTPLCGWHNDHVCFSRLPKFLCASW